MRRPTALILTVFALSCGQSLSCGGCAGFGPIPGGDFTGVRSDSAAAARLTASGFDVLNVNAPALLQAIAPNGDLDIPLSCSVQNASILGQLVIADEGALTCTMPSCGYLDGKCDAQDVPKTVSVHFNTFHVAPKGPDQIEATADITLTTNGKIHMRSPQNHLLCLLSNPIELSVDLDTQRVAPPDITIAAGIRLTVDPRWWKLLSFEVASLDGTKACGTSGALPSPECIDSADMLVASENSCSSWLGTVGNIDAVKGLILSQITTTLQSKIQDALANANCRPCGPNGECPTNGSISSFCQYDDGGTPDSGVCFDPGVGECVPKLIGVEGRLDISNLLGAVGAPQNAALDISVAAGGATSANDAGFSLGFEGGALESVTASCVKPLPEPNLPALPLPDFDTWADGPYDLGVSVSQQMLIRMLLHAEQSGALCLELGHETISLLDSSLVGTLLPSLDKLTHGKSVPMRVVIRPVNPPTATIQSGMGIEPLITLNWNDAQIDVYAQLDDRYARLFTVSFDLALPLTLSIDGCATLTPTIGDLSTAITDVHAINSEILAEPLTSVEMLVPALISFAEPALANGIMGFTLPAFGDFQVQLLSAKGVDNISGTQMYNHLGVYMNLLPANQTCVGMSTPMHHLGRASMRKGARAVAELDVGTMDREYSWRMPNGLWSQWQRADAMGLLSVNHPRLMLRGQRIVEIRTRAKGLFASAPASVLIDER
jgi:hypothetical protein